MRIYHHSVAIFCRSDNSTQIRLCDCSLLDLKAFDKHTDLPIALFEVVCFFFVHAVRRLIADFVCSVTGKPIK